MSGDLRPAFEFLKGTLSLREMRRQDGIAQLACLPDNTGNLDQDGWADHYLGQSCKVLLAARTSLLFKEGNRILIRRLFLHKGAALVPFHGITAPTWQGSSITV